ncbi:MAG: protease inhibitor I42 family protein [Flavobacteriales bacterium]|nr:protease inhibitor I42 family protein [Flavobacteriales bacterium]
MKKYVAMALICVFTLSFQSRVIKVRQGEIFKVILKANHSTGYSWQWENKTNKSKVDSVYMGYVLSDKAITGSGGNEIWEFKAKRKGEQKLIMIYKRPWEKDGVIEKKEILVKVE